MTHTTPSPAEANNKAKAQVKTPEEKTKPKPVNRLTERQKNDRLDKLARRYGVKNAKDKMNEKTVGVLEEDGKFLWAQMGRNERLLIKIQKQSVGDRWDAGDFVLKVKTITGGAYKPWCEEHGFEIETARKALYLRERLTRKQAIACGSITAAMEEAKILKPRRPKSKVVDSTTPAEGEPVPGEPAPGEPVPGEPAPEPPFVPTLASGTPIYSYDCGEDDDGRCFAEIKTRELLREEQNYFRVRREGDKEDAWLGEGVHKSEGYLDWKECQNHCLDDLYKWSDTLKKELEDVETQTNKIKGLTPPKQANGSIHIPLAREVINFAH